MQSIAPTSRCAVGFRDGVKFLFVTLPKPGPPPRPPEIEPLMFFDSAPPLSTPSEAQTGEVYRPGSVWEHGFTIIPLEVNANGDLRRSTRLSRLEYDSWEDVRYDGGSFSYLEIYAAVFGALLLDKLYVLVAHKVHGRVPLPLSGTLTRVLETRWIAMQLPDVAPLKMTPSDRTRLREFQEYYHYNGYYYSDDVDPRVPFPFTHPPHRTPPNLQCDWFYHLRQPFRQASLRAACSVLVRGYVGERGIPLRDGPPLHMLLLGRQNSRNPGPRYYGRGLNTVHAAGNDHVYEYILWRQTDAHTVTYARHTFLRGTVPVHWKTKVGVSFADAAMIFSPNRNDVLQGSAEYFDHTLRTLAQMTALDSNGETVVPPQVRCVSLLRGTPGGEEAVLGGYYADAVRAYTPALRRTLPDASLDVVHIDWHNLTRDFGVEYAVSSLWDGTVGFLAARAEPGRSFVSVGSLARDGTVCRLVGQTNFLRVNCADSLDRTNLGCFFVALQASVEMLGVLHVKPSAVVAAPPLPPLALSDDAASSSLADAFAPRAPRDGPAIPSPFPRTWAEARDAQKIAPLVVTTLADLFVDNGDCVALLYTNSAAMHGNVLRGLCGMKPGGYNAVIATQRRYENWFGDQRKFRNLELLLGQNQGVHFPSMSRIFLTRPVALPAWSSTILVVGFPDGVSTADMDSALRECWDRAIGPQQLAQQNAPIRSSALCFTVTMQGIDRERRDAYEEAVRSLSCEEPDPDTTRPPEMERVAVVEFDLDLTRVIPVTSLFLVQGSLLLKGVSAYMAPYSYPIQDPSDTGRGVGQTMKSMGTSLKRGLRSMFMD